MATCGLCGQEISAHEVNGKNEYSCPSCGNLNSADIDYGDNRVHHVKRYLILAGVSCAVLAFTVWAEYLS